MGRQQRDFIQGGARRPCGLEAAYGHGVGPSGFSLRRTVLVIGVTAKTEEGGSITIGLKEFGFGVSERVGKRLVGQWGRRLQDASDLTGTSAGAMKLGQSHGCLQGSELRREQPSLQWCTRAEGM